MYIRASQRFNGRDSLCVPPSWVLPIWVGVLESYSLHLFLWVHLPRWVESRRLGRIETNSQKLCVNGELGMGRRIPGRWHLRPEDI